MLSQSYDNSSDESKDLYFENLKAWLLSLSKQIKGDKWEELIIKKTFLVLDDTLEKYKKDFLS